MRSLKRSNDHFQKAVTRLPLGVASNFRYWGDEGTIYIKRAKGARIWDIDDNEYIDYRLGYGPAILGYADQRVDEAARAGMEVGGVFALATEREFAVADRISKMVPAAELVRFSNSGTEAVMAALRLARAHTGKDGYVMVDGGYHGQFDAVLWQIPDSVSSESEAVVVPFGEGGVLCLLRQNVQALHEGKTRVDHRRELSREDYDVASRDPRTKLKRELLRLLLNSDGDQPLLVEKSNDVFLFRKLDLALFDVAARRRAGTPIESRHIGLPTGSLSWS